MTSTSEESVPKRTVLDIIQSWKTVDDIVNYYDEVADRYIKASVMEGWVSHKLLAEAFVNLNIPKTARILDFCAGPGLLGDELHKHGYCNIDALDGASKMLEKCRNLGNVYSNLFEHVVTVDQPFPSGCADYDAVLISNSVYPRLISFNDLRRIVKIIKRGGVLGFNVTIMDTPVVDENFTEAGIKVNVTSLVEDGTLEPIEGFYPKKECVSNYEGQTFLAKTVY